MSIVESAKREMKAANFDEDDSRVMVEILEKFFAQWDSGGAVYAMAPVLQRLIAGKPIGPLTGEDSEWYQPMDTVPVLQNLRCGSVFKDWRLPDGELSHVAGEGKLTVHDLDNPTWDGEFPYSPDGAEVQPPEMIVG